MVRRLQWNTHTGCRYYRAPISSKNVTGIPASAPAELINGTFVGTDINAPGADLSYSQLILGH